ncbi:hypothetical protein SAMD00019534_107250 [Acytostelium subglobosum LB1]|uniref:hypothetical protein n=1 Tax=Acytostelium subglobosum LB1 TaxID=1410327 RepID=UPI000644EC6C|nr:hypothetical protein SAMD00019534_107250 [Acytostelium subglobosum LB1]GAM27549.1 hypothetical protein SAMD00019534_107250 [Acytostelium subglobosum LB1]|eukprot:XP_012749614.1 hypothetical protein SAMD00019534_107250 [Acytostelium subglobosum LB1]
MTVADKTFSSLGAKILNAGTKIGFMYLKNTPITDVLKRHTLEQTKRLFDMPMSEKQQFAQSAENTRGYYRFEGVGYGESVTLDENLEEQNTTSNKTDDYIEAFLMGNDQHTPWTLKKEYYKKRFGITSARQYQSLAHCQPNQWPSTSTSNDTFRQDMNEYYNACTLTSRLIIETIALSLGLPRDHFVHLHNNNDHTMELKHYCPSQTKPTDVATPTSVRMKEHADLSTVTLLIQNEGTGGLQLWSNDANKWIDAPFVPDAILVNTGNIMERLSNGVYLNTMHRVVLNPYQTQHSRYSVVFFYVPDWDKDVGNGDLMGDLIPFS